MTKSYSNLHNLLVVCVVFLLSSFYSFSAFGQCNPSIIDGSFNPTDRGFGNGDGFFSEGNNYNYSQGYTASVQPDDKVIIGGFFTHYNGIEAANIARLNTNGKLDSTFSLDPNLVKADKAELLPNGQIIVRGWYSVDRPSIVRLNSDGSIDPSFFSTGTGSYNLNSGVAGNDLREFKVLNNQQILVQGHFQQYNDVPSLGLALLNADGTIDANFQSRFSVRIQDVDIIAQQPDGKILLFGDFDSYDGTTVRDFMRINLDGSLDNTFNIGISYRTGVRDIKVQDDGKILISGGFTSFNGNPVPQFIRLNPNGSKDNTFTPPTLVPYGNRGISIDKFVIQDDNKIIIAGRLGQSQTNSNSEVMRLNPNGTIDNSFSSVAAITSLSRPYSQTVDGLVVQSDGKIIINRGTDRLFLSKSTIRLHQDGRLDTSYNIGTGSNGNLNTIAVQPDNKIMIGGQFGNYNGQKANLFARLNPNGTLDNSFILYDWSFDNADSKVNRIAIQDNGKIVIAGKFSNYQGYHLLLRLYSDGSIDNTFQNILDDFGNGIDDLVIQSDGKIIILGHFSINGITHELIRLNTDGSLDTSFSPPPHTRHRLALDNDGKIYTIKSGIPNEEVMRLNTDGSIDNTFTTPTGFTQATIAVNRIVIDQNNKVVVVGKFIKYNWVLARNILRLNSDGSMDDTFDHGVHFDYEPIYDVYIQENGKIMVGGSFQRYNNNQDLKCLAVLNADGTLDASFEASVGANYPVKSITIQPNYGILIAGEFTGFNGVGKNRIARLGADAPPTPSLNVQTSAISGLCPNTQTTLRATGTARLYWYDSPTSILPLAEGDTLRTPLLVADSTYFYVQDSTVGCGSSDRLEILVTTSGILSAISKPNYTAYLDANGNIEVNAIVLDSISSAGCGNTIASYLFDDTGLATRSFSCTDTNSVHNVILRVTDNNGNTETSPTIIHVKDTIRPLATVRVFPVIFNYTNQATVFARDFITSLSDNCTDSSNINVVFNNTGLDSLQLDCGNNAVTNLTLRITDQAGNQTIQPVFMNTSDASYDFNVNIISTNFRPAIISTLTVLANNYSCAPKSGELKVTLPSNVTYNSASITPTRIVGNDLFWDVTDLSFDRSFVTRIQVLPNISLNIGDEVCFTGHITPETTDYYRANNLKYYCFPIVNSYDPNDKQVYPQGICTDKFTKRSDLPLTYTIRFQNTGNAPALNVRIADSLSTLLNRRSLRVVGSSHAMVVDTVAGNNVINFRFNNINLPDSTSNPELSQGYVIFELNEIAAHTDTSRISNKSYIYFDTNAPIITNTVKNTIVNTLPLCNPAGGGSTPIAACQLPTNLRTEILSSTKVKLAWTNPVGTNAINYEILRNGQRLITVPASNLSFIDSTLIANTQYNYSIKAICGNSVATSNVVQVRTIPATPILLSVVAACKGEKGKINVQSAGATYRVYSSLTATTPLFESNNASIETPILSDSTTFYISVIINGLESQRLKAIVPIKEVFEAKIEQGNLFETCATEFNLSAKPVQNATYTWFRDNVEVGTGRTLTTTFAARYKVRVIKNGCFAESEFTTTRFVSAPTAKIQQGNTVSFCGSGTLNAQDTSANVVYTWSLNGTNVGNGTAINVSQSGTYTLKASQPSCESSVTIAVTITNAPANVALTASKTAICTDTQTTLSATTGTGFTYKWFKNNVTISNTSATLSTSEIGKYKVEVTTADGCKVTTSEVEITRLQVNQATLRINTESGRDKTIDVTSQDAIDSVQWFKDGVLIPAFANKILITPTETGNYKAKVTYSTGCKSETTEKTFTIGGVTGIEEESAKIFSIYPNPNNGSFKVEFFDTNNQKTNLVLVDGLGRIIYSQEISINEKAISITLPKISAGVYVVQIISEGKVYTKQLVIQ